MTKMTTQQDGKALDRHAQVMNRALVAIQGSLSRLSSAQGKAFGSVQNKVQFKAASDDLNRAVKALQDQVKEYADGVKAFTAAVQKQDKAKDKQPTAPGARV